MAEIVECADRTLDDLQGAQGRAQRVGLIAQEIALNPIEDVHVTGGHVRRQEPDLGDPGRAKTQSTIVLNRTAWVSSGR